MIWSHGYQFALRLRELNRQPNPPHETFRTGIEHTNPCVWANVVAGLIKTTNYLLDRQIKHLEEDFERHGGLRERMPTERIAARDQQRRRAR